MAVYKTEEYDPNEYGILQFAFKDKIYVAGKANQVIAYLRTLANRYGTVREYLEQQTEGL